MAVTKLKVYHKMLSIVLLLNQKPPKFLLVNFALYTSVAVSSIKSTNSYLLFLNIFLLPSSG